MTDSPAIAAIIAEFPAGRWHEGKWSPEFHYLGTELHSAIRRAAAVAREEATLAEREACAKIVDSRIADLRRAISEPGHFWQEELMR